VTTVLSEIRPPVFGGTGSRFEWPGKTRAGLLAGEEGQQVHAIEFPFRLWLDAGRGQCGGVQVELNDRLAKPGRQPSAGRLGSHQPQRGSVHGPPFSFAAECGTLLPTCFVATFRLEATRLIASCGDIVDDTP